MNFRYLPRATRWSLFFLIAALFMMFSIRALMLWQNGNYFDELSYFQVLLAFFNGFRFDLSILLLFCGIPLLILQLPIFSRHFLRLFMTISFLLFQPLLLLLLADLLFFKESNFHIGNQLLLIGDDLPFILDMAIHQYWPYLFAYVLLLVAPIVIIYRLSRGDDSHHPRLMNTVYFILFGLVLFFGINGKVGLKIDRMISTSDAFSQGSVPFGNLSLNGGFTSFQVIKEKRWKNRVKYFSSSDAIDLAKRSLLYSGLAQNVSNFPLLFSLEKFYAPSMPSNSNVMIIMLESWSAQYLDSFASDGQIKLGITPFFDSLAEEGIRFTHFYPNGSMSLYGASSILTSLPPMPRLPALGKGIEVYDLMRPGKIFQQLGRKTFAAQSSIRVSFRLNTIAHYLGFEDYFGKEDYIRENALESPTNGWDGETFSYLKKYLPSINGSFFGFIFTGTTHIPYLVPDDSFKKYDHSEKDITGFYNTLYYSDAMLGQFMKWCKTQKWFDDTLFVFVADHTLNRSVMGEQSRIPLLLYAPKWLKPQTLNTLGSQVDILPTVFDILRIDAPYAGIGRSLFSPGEKFVINETSQRMGIIASDGHFLQHDLKTLISSNFQNKGKEKNALDKMLSIEQAILETVEKNMLYTSQPSKQKN